MVVMSNSNRFNKEDTCKERMVKVTDEVYYSVVGLMQMNNISFNETLKGLIESNLETVKFIESMNEKSLVHHKNKLKPCNEEEKFNKGVLMESVLENIMVEMENNCCDIKVDVRRNTRVLNFSLKTPEKLSSDENRLKIEIYENMFEFNKICSSVVENTLGLRQRRELKPVVDFSCNFKLVSVFSKNYLNELASKLNVYLICYDIVIRGLVIFG